MSGHRLPINTLGMSAEQLYAEVFAQCERCGIVKLTSGQTDICRFANVSDIHGKEISVVIRPFTVFSALKILSLAKGSANIGDIAGLVFGEAPDLGTFRLLPMRSIYDACYERGDVKGKIALARILSMHRQLALYNCSLKAALMEALRIRTTADAVVMMRSWEVDGDIHLAQRFRTVRPAR